MWRETCMSRIRMAEALMKSKTKNGNTQERLPCRQVLARADNHANSQIPEHGLQARRHQHPAQERPMLWRRRRSFHMRPAVADKGHSRVIPVMVPCSSPMTFMRIACDSVDQAMTCPMTVDTHVLAAMKNVPSIADVLCETGAQQRRPALVQCNEDYNVLHFGPSVGAAEILDVSLPFGRCCIVSAKSDDTDRRVVCGSTACAGVNRSNVVNRTWLPRFDH